MIGAFGLPEPSPRYRFSIVAAFGVRSPHIGSHDGELDLDSVAIAGHEHIAEREFRRAVQRELYQASARRTDHTNASYQKCMSETTIVIAHKVVRLESSASTPSP